jgi:hypothetical protein
VDHHPLPSLTENDVVLLRPHQSTSPSSAAHQEAGLDPAVRPLIEKDIKSLLLHESASRTRSSPLQDGDRSDSSSSLHHARRIQRHWNRSVSHTARKKEDNNSAPLIKYVLDRNSALELPFTRLASLHRSRASVPTITADDTVPSDLTLEETPRFSRPPSLRHHRARLSRHSYTSVRSKRRYVHVDDDDG